MSDWLKTIAQKFTNASGSLTAIFAAITLFLESIGCKAGDAAVDFSATCDISWLDPKYSAILAGGFGVITFLQKLMRPGGWLRSIFGSTAVVVSEDSPKSTAGTVTPQQVAQP